MNYYNPNYYQNYSYTPQQQYNQFQNQQLQTPVLNGKIVDSIDVVRVTEVPIGGYGIFPKADMSEIYLKTWNQNGTTSILTFQPVLNQEENKENDINILVQKIEILEGKIDEILAMPKTAEKRKVSDY